MQRLHFLGLAFGLLFCVGCGSDLSTVSGTVTLDGQPAPGLVVAFVPEGGGTTAAATTDEQGHYQVTSALGPGLPPGSYKVTVTTEMTVETTEAEEEAYSGGSDSADYASQAAGNDYSDAKKFVEKIPPKYNSNSTLTADVEEGSNTLDFELVTN